MRAGIAAVAGPVHRTAGPAFRSGRQLLFPSIAETLTRHLRLLDRRATDDNPDDRCDRVSAFASSSRGMAIMLNALSTLLVGELLLPGLLIWKGGPSPEFEGFEQKPAVVARHVVRARGYRAMTAFDQLATDWLMQRLSNARDKTESRHDL
ncbi:MULTISPECIES: hypothetical protein [Burkholderia]|nr:MULTISPECIES: hypothetical protein [Burkholderia]MBH9643256.1 hypothetical protein [Burkholderia vietnamiensis]MBR7910790.1 hypothetical protein [Burkholderia vietnamiensis]MBR7997576.1 hypothetical protein [Burkholderia vietnamiensis]MBR8011043.1 hypothetical protein [Burkholderia vietnamiensis]MBR8081293.1 hypothetical protein [Burkholderia vietnamiensis]